MEMNFAEEMAEAEVEKVAYFYVDETLLKIEGKKHVIVGALTPTSPAEASLEMVKVKAELGFAPLDEVKMNTRGLTRDLKIKLTDGVLGILGGCTAFISIVEGEDKQIAAEVLALQVLDYCNQNNKKAYFLYFDKDLVPRPREFENYVRRRLTDGANCIGIQHLNSSGEQLVQCCDVFLGLFRLSMEIELGGRVIKRAVYRGSLDEEEEWSLSEYVIVSTRGQVWGEQKMMNVSDDPEYEDITYPFHCSMNLGVRIASTISQEIKQTLEDRLATAFMGCLS